MALWQVKDDLEEPNYVSRLKSLQVPEYGIMKPRAVNRCNKAEKVRALAYNDNLGVSLFSQPNVRAFAYNDNLGVSLFS